MKQITIGLSLVIGLIGSSECQAQQSKRYSPGELERRAINERAIKLRARQLQSLQGRGLGGTTIRKSIERGIEADRRRSISALNNRILSQRTRQEQQARQAAQAAAHRAQHTRQSEATRLGLAIAPA